ncbi:nuclear transport factor 2 family protein [Rhodococcus jostii]|uniref:nuclear transport factor 2 family protein n=1 Tax=Rhodococcus jostii TaxID=132919 RepID=UPI00364B6698
MNDIDILIAERDIERVLATYCRGVDRGDADLVANCYQNESLDVHGRYRGDGKQFAAYVGPVLARRYVSTSHTLGQSLIQFDSSTRAYVETYFVAYHSADPSSGDPHLYIFGGRYLDRFDRSSGRWLIAKRAVVRDFSHRTALDKEEIERQTEESAPFRSGARNRNDLAYPDAFESWLADIASSAEQA